MKTGLLVLVLAICCTTTSVYAQFSPATIANITNEEFLDLYFQIILHRHEVSDVLNSFNLISFYPSTNSKNALLFIIQTYNDEDHSTENPQLRRGIREVGAMMVDQFQAHLRLPILKKRWLLSNPKANLIIKHVRVHDIQDILAVTIDGITSFHPTDFKRAEQRVKMAGGIWTF